MILFIVFIAPHIWVFNRIKKMIMFIKRIKKMILIIVFIAPHICGLGVGLVHCVHYASYTLFIAVHNSIFSGFKNDVRTRIFVIQITDPTSKTLISSKMKHEKWFSLICSLRFTIPLSRVWKMMLEHVFLWFKSQILPVKHEFHQNWNTKYDRY